jgi:predicted NodU family carbamoyl transferase
MSETKKQLNKRIEERVGSKMFFIIFNISLNIYVVLIVCSLRDAFKCFMDTELDVLAVGNYLLVKKNKKRFLNKDMINFMS